MQIGTGEARAARLEWNDEDVHTGGGRNHARMVSQKPGTAVNRSF